MPEAHELPSLADAPDTMREYETIYILRPGTTNDGVAEVNERVRAIIEDRGGVVIKVDNWGKRRLAYEVKKERKGIYLYWQYLAGRGIVEEFERNMRMLDPVIRYQTVRLDSDIDPSARPTEVDDEMYERAAITAADEEDMYLTREEGEGEGEGEAAAAGEGEAEKATAAEGETATATAAEGETDAAAEGEKATATEGETATATATTAEAKTDGEAAPADAKPETTEEE